MVIAAPVARWDAIRAIAEDGGQRDRHGFRCATGVRRSDPSEAQALAVRAAVGAFLEVRPALVLQVPQVADQAGRGGRAHGAGTRWPGSWLRVTPSEPPRAPGCSWSSGRSERVLASSSCRGWPTWTSPTPRRSSPIRTDSNCPNGATGPSPYSLRWRTVAIAHGDAASWSAAWRVVARVAANAPDVATLAARALAGARPDGAELPSGLLQIAPVLRAAGLLSGEAQA